MFSSVITLLLIRAVSAEALYQRAKRIRDGYRCPAGLFLRILFRLGAPGFLWVLFVEAVPPRDTYEWWLQWVGVALAVTIPFLEPREIRTGPTGVTQRGPLGFGTRRVAWEGAAASYTRELHEVMLVGTNGATITHTRYHVGQDEFIDELRRRRVHIQ